MQVCQVCPSCAAAHKRIAEPLKVAPSIESRRHAIGLFPCSRAIWFVAGLQIPLFFFFPPPPPGGGGGEFHA